MDFKSSPARDTVYNTKKIYQSSLCDRPIVRQATRRKGGMTYKISSIRQNVILTFTPDMSINSPNLSRTGLLLDHAMSSSISVIIFDLASVSFLNSIGSWTLFHVAVKAKDCGKKLFLFNVAPAIKSDLLRAGLLSLAPVIHTQNELDHVLRGNYSTPSPASLHSLSPANYTSTAGHRNPREMPA
jgi:anti-anti-sigma regulatory factor